MRKNYFQPVMLAINNVHVAAPLAFFSAATAAAAALGAAVGALTTKAMIRAIPNEVKNFALHKIED